MRVRKKCQQNDGIGISNKNLWRNSVVNIIQYEISCFKKIIFHTRFVGLIIKWNGDSEVEAQKDVFYLKNSAGDKLNYNLSIVKLI